MSDNDLFEEPEYGGNWYPCDEWDYEHEEPDFSYVHFLCKAPNGHLYLEEVTLVRQHYQDWGECDAYSYFEKINGLSPEKKQKVIEYGKTMEPCSAVSLAKALYNDEDEE